MLAPLLFGIAIAQSRGGVLAQLRAEAESLKSYPTSNLAKSFLEAVPKLADPGKRTIYLDEDSKAYYPNKAQGRKELELDGRFYYYTKYGSPLAYLRAVDLLGGAGMNSFKMTKVVDFGYGGIGPLQLAALNGGRATGVDIDSILKALYSRPEDMIGGRIKLVEGFFPADPATVRAIGAEYDAFLSKNTLKRGYVHPEREADKRMLIDLGVSDGNFCRAVAKLLKKGGLFLIYNLCPAQNRPEKPFLPMADGRSPFTKETIERAGFEVLAFNQVDDAKIRELGHLLGWDKGQTSEEFEGGLFAWYTLARKR